MWERNRAYWPGTGQELWDVVHEEWVAVTQVYIGAQCLAAVGGSALLIFYLGGATLTEMRSFLLSFPVVLLYYSSWWLCLFYRSVRVIGYWCIYLSVGLLMLMFWLASWFVGCLIASLAGGWLIGWIILVLTEGLFDDHVTRPWCHKTQVWYLVTISGSTSHKLNVAIVYEDWTIGTYTCI